MKELFLKNIDSQENDLDTHLFRDPARFKVTSFLFKTENTILVSNCETYCDFRIKGFHGSIKMLSSPFQMSQNFSWLKKKKKPSLNRNLACSVSKLVRVLSRDSGETLSCVVQTSTLWAASTSVQSSSRSLLVSSSFPGNI